MTQEVWAPIFEFPDYQISNLGRVYNSRRDCLMSVNHTNHGHAKIALLDDTGERRTRSVAVLVAEAFVVPPNLLCDQVVLLDGDLDNVIARNLVWRPRWFAWKYTRQLKTQQPVHYINLPVVDIVAGSVYESVIVAGMTEGLLFDNVWRSTYTGVPVYPSGSIFEVA